MTKREYRSLVQEGETPKRVNVFLELLVKEGEREHYHRSVHQLPVDSKAGTNTAHLDKWANEYAKDYYMGKSEWNKEYDAYEFDLGCVLVAVNEVRSISEEDYITLKKYL